MLQFLSGILPESFLQKKTIVKKQGVWDIANEVCKAHEVFAKQYDNISDYFWAGSTLATCKKLFNFCKSEMMYCAESDEDQTTRSPAAILKTAKSWGVDCKHYAGFIGGVIDSLNRKGKNINWCYRFVSYDPDSDEPGHVFIVVQDGNKVIFVDPVLDTLDQRTPKYFFKTDKFCGMALHRINGFTDTRVVKRSVGYVAPDEVKQGGGASFYPTVNTTYPMAVPVVTKEQLVLSNPPNTAGQPGVIMTMAQTTGGAANTPAPMEQTAPAPAATGSKNWIWWLLIGGVILLSSQKK